jgi:uncharacterized membrane protein
MNILRMLKHLMLPDWWRRRVFAAADLAVIGAAVSASEQTHRGEVRFVAEASLTVAALWRDRSPRQRAAEVFAAEGVWDTEENSGILIYVLLADRRVEILADRGIAARVPQAEWDAICRGMEQASGRTAGGGARRRTARRPFPGRRDQPQRTTRSTPDAVMRLADSLG